MEKPLHIETPLFESRALTLHTGRTIWLKMEAMQPTGSFKIRGIGHACQKHARRGVKRFISSSGGNAGIAVAYAGRHLSVPVVVVVPKTTTGRAIALIQQEDAKVVVHGDSWDEANELAELMVEESNERAALLHPFDDLDDCGLWEGHASLVDEIVRSGVKPEVVILSVGGGGLLCGVVEGLNRNGWTDVPVIAVETKGADSFAQSIREGRRVKLPDIDSKAKSLGAKQICEQAFSWSKKHSIHSIVVSDRAAVSACERFLDDHRVLVEPACGASLAVVYDRIPELEQYKSILVVVCGGVTMSAEQLQEWMRELGITRRSSGPPSAAAELQR